MNKWLSFLLAPLFLLPACFLNQDAPPPTPEPSPTIRGLVQVQDLIGTDDKGPFQLAVFDGVFGKEVAAKGVRLTKNRTTASSEVPSCDKVVKRPVEKAGQITTIAVMSVGTVTFSSVLQSTSLFDISENEKTHRYRSELPPALAEGDYVIQSSGVGNIKPLTGKLSLPEEIRYVKVNGDFLDRGVHVKKSTPLKFEWPLAKPNPSNQILMSILSRVNGIDYILVCYGLEDKFQINAEVSTFEIPIDSLSQIPESKAAIVDWMRIHDLGDKDSPVLTEGVRRMAALSQIEP